MDATIDLSGYQITEKLYSGSRTLVYRGIKESDQQRVVIKLLRNEFPSFNELVQFRNQYLIAKNLNSANIITTYSIESYHNSYVLIMEDFGGISLKQLTGKESGLSVEDFLQIAIDLCATLDILYQERIIHKDIKPANILINPATKQIKLIDFSIASLLPRETQEIQNANSLEGTLAYLSPEQTGRMNRGIDYRSDFYALGVTFYELLTGELPFQSNDPMELIHCHLAKTPTSVHEINPQIPLVLSGIITKLMAKNAEDRYQSALGIKHDLEICLEQLQSTGQITDFAIGQRDISDRFIIPEKLYGREGEVDQLLAAFDRVASPSENRVTGGSPLSNNSELILVAGFSGIGKTAVVNEVHKPITKQKGYFIKGKYDQFQRNIPFSAFVQAFRDLMEQLLSESDRQLDTWKTKILEVVGDNGQVLIDVIPELELIIGKQQPATELSGAAAQNRFNLLMQNFIKIFTSQEHPLVMFIDDLQWSDSASQNLLKLLMQDTKYLLFLGAYRDNEVSPTHPFILTVDEVAKTGAVVNTITLQPLSLEDTNQLVADTLNCELSLAQPLTKLVYQKTKGNPFFATQFLKALHDDKLISFDREIRHWQCDIAKVQALSLTDDVVEFMALQLQKLPTETQNLLKLAACIGAEFDLHTLAIVSEKSTGTTATALWKALQEGLIIPTTKIYKFFTQSEGEEAFETAANPTYRFLHDRIQQAAYSLIPDNQKQATHLSIGQLLLSSTSEADLETNMIFEIAGHLNISSDLITQTDKKIELAKLNSIAGRKAKAAIAYDAALEYFTFGLDLLPEDIWQTDYDFSLALHEGATEICYLCKRNEQMQQLAEIVIDRSKMVLDRIKVQEIQISAQIAQAELATAIALAIDILKQLGVDLPIEPSGDDIQAIQAEITTLLPASNLQSLLDLPPMTDANLIAALTILDSIHAPSYLYNQALFALVILTEVKLSLLHGNSPLSPIAYAGYGCLLMNAFQQPDLSYEFGLLSLEMSDRFGDLAVEAQTIHLVTSFILPLKQSLRDYAPIRHRGIAAAIESSNIESLGWIYCNGGADLFFLGTTLTDLESTLVVYGDRLLQFDQIFQLTIVQVVHQTILNLLGRAEDPGLLVGEIFDEVAVIARCQTVNTHATLATTGIFKVILNCILDRPEQARDAAEWVKPYLYSITGNTSFLWFYCYDSLAQLGAFPSLSPTEQDRALEQVVANQLVLQNLADRAPMNFQAKFDLVKAEHCRVLGQQYEAMELYDRAILGAKENQYIQEEALANELAAKFFLGWGKAKIATSYMQEAYYCYARWGAKAKVVDLEARYPKLLEPILRQAKISFDPQETLMDMTHTLGQAATSSTNIADTLDFVSVLKAAQTISSEIKLDDLLRQLTQIILQNSGADRCILVLPQDEIWQVRAIATIESTELCLEPLEDNANIPLRLIHYIKRMKCVVVIDNLETDLPIIDDYLNQHQPKSTLGLPILNQGTLAGIIYLENQSTAGVFNSDRLTIINFLGAQAAISIKNAQLYQQSQTYAQQLQQSQLQIIQSEKMSALGNLVAGVAHEINNPVGFLNGNIQPALDYIHDLFGLIDLYQQKYPQLDTDIQAEIETIELEYIREDLPRLVSSMQEGVKRIQDISNSLRTFSRADTDYPVACNIHDGIDSTIMILKHRLKANEVRPEIQVIKNYGNLPQIECYAGQMNQVFVNILANAIDALDDSNQDRTFADIKANPNCITITTSVENNRVKIAIDDNGKGMSADIKVKVFDHLFTTKLVGKGTGLGLAIAQQIVIEKHGGAIEVNSIAGQGTEFSILLPITK